MNQQLHTPLSLPHKQGRQLSFSGTVSRKDYGLGTFLEAPNGKDFVVLLEAFRATGGTAPGEFLSRLLEELNISNDVSLDNHIQMGNIFGFEWRGRIWIPMFQFDTEDLSLKVEAQLVRSALPASWGGWVLASWFAAPQPSLNNHCPADMLDIDFDAVMRAAHQVHASEGFEPAHVQRIHQLAEPF